MQSKWFLLSRGILGPLLAMAGVVLAANGVDFDQEQQRVVLTQFDAFVGSAMTLAGSLLGMYGRAKASQSLTFLP